MPQVGFRTIDGVRIRCADTLAQSGSVLPRLLAAAVNLARPAVLGLAGHGGTWKVPASQESRRGTGRTRAPFVAPQRPPGSARRRLDLSQHLARARAREQP